MKNKRNAGVFSDVFGMLKARKSGLLEEMDNAIKQLGNKGMRTETNKILDPIMQAVKNFDFEKIDDYLDLRDTEPFDKAWVQANDIIKINIDKENIDFQKQEVNLREVVFKRVAKFTQHDELAGYISDDAGLIFANQYFKVNNKFTN